MQWSISEHCECLSFQTLCFSTPENLLVGISGAQGMKERHFLSKNMFSENAVEYLWTLWMLELSNLCHCVQHPWKLTSRDFWSSRNERKALSQQKCVFEKMQWSISEHWWMPELSNICHCVQHPWKLTSRDDWSSRNKGKPLSKLKHVFWEKMQWEYIRNGECWSFQTFSIVFSTPENLLVGISGVLGIKESHFLS